VRCYELGGGAPGDAKMPPEPAMRIALFVPCYVEHLQPEVALATARLLRRLGHSVRVPSGQTCCGQPAFNAGLRDVAVAAARRFLRIFGRALDDGAEAIVCPSGSCAAMVKLHYPELALSDEERAAHSRLEPAVHELTEFLVDCTGQTDIGARVAERVALHKSCHALRGLGISAQPEALLAKVTDLEPAPLMHPETCCGFGGVFSVKLPEVSTALADRKLDDALGVGAEVLTGVDPACLMHLEGRARRRGLPLRFEHIASLLERGAGLR